MKKRIFSLGLALSLIFTQTPAYAMSTFSDGSEEITVFDSEPAFTSEPTAKGNNLQDEMIEENGNDEVATTLNVFEENIEVAKSSQGQSEQIYSIHNKILTINKGKSLSLDTIEIKNWMNIKKIINNGTIILNKSISPFTEIELINQLSGEIQGYFWDNVDVKNYGVISGGTFYNNKNTIINYGTISGGAFYKNTIANYGTISGGEFGTEEEKSCTIKNYGTVSGGDFKYVSL